MLLGPNPRLVRSFRTPLVLRGFLLAAATIFPILFAPSFAHEAAHDDGVGAVSAYAMSACFAVVNSVLVNMQRVLEDPFDGDTADDISLALFEPQWGFWTADHTGRQTPG